jgi:hypothetical protein
MMADVPVGVFLSGGLDSSVVAAILARESAEGPVHSFAAGTPGSSDLAAARVVADAAVPAADWAAGAGPLRDRLSRSSGRRRGRDVGETRAT